MGAKGTFTLPPELSGAVPRQVRLTAGGIAVALAAIAMAIGALVSPILMSVAYSATERERQLRQREGIAAQAEVVQVAVKPGEHPRSVVTYRYEVDGRSYTGRTVLRPRDHATVTRGTVIPIVYLSSHPEMSWTIGYEPEGFPIWAIPLTSASLIVAAAAIAWGVRRQWALLSEGRAALARITGHKRIRRDKREGYRVSYEFQALSGASHTARYQATKTPPPIGTMIPVVYHRDRPQWSAPYPFGLVRPRRFPRRMA